jgi:hypothetical protein
LTDIGIDLCWHRCTIYRRIGYKNGLRKAHEGYEGDSDMTMIHEFPYITVLAIFYSPFLEMNSPLANFCLGREKVK